VAGVDGEDRDRLGASGYEVGSEGRESDLDLYHNSELDQDLRDLEAHWQQETMTPLPSTLHAYFPSSEKIETHQSSSQSYITANWNLRSLSFKICKPSMAIYRIQPL